MSAEIAELEAAVRHHNRLYWDDAAPEISDTDYDLLVRKLRALAPESPALGEMGPAAIGSEVRHASPMLSLDKCYSEGELAEWARTFTGDVVAMSKFDGVACSLHYDEAGRLTVAATRGDGVVGDDVTINVRRIADVPAKIPAKGPIEIRGEIYMRLSVFEKFKAEGMANPRNLTAGAVKQKDADKSASYKLSFAAYDLEGVPYELHQEALAALERFGFSRVDHFVVDRESAASAYEKFAELRPKLDYEIDGVVFKVASTKEQRRLGATSHHPRYAIAYKFQGDSGVTTLREVEWSVARTGAITPVAIVEPLALSGVTVTRASLHNVAFIDRLGLTLGAKVTVVRRGGVIPNVEFVNEPGPDPVPIPTVCPSSGAPVVRRRDFLYCSAPESCRRAVIGQLAHFAASLDMLGFGDSMLEQLYDASLLRSPADFFTLLPAQIAGLERSGDKIAKKLVAEVDKRRTIELATFLRALGIDELGRKVSQLLADRYRTLDAVLGVGIEELAALHGVGDSIATSVVLGLAAARPRIDALRPHLTFVERTRETTGIFAGKSFVFTGKMVAFARSDGEKRVRERGGDVLSSVTKALTYLVVGADKSGPKSTKEKAADKQIKEGAPLKILSEEAFLAMLDGAEPIAAAMPAAVEAEVEGAPLNVEKSGAPAPIAFDERGQGKLF
jgi:DNA ligase (NAD+)